MAKSQSGGLVSRIRLTVPDGCDGSCRATGSPKRVGSEEGAPAGTSLRHLGLSVEILGLRVCSPTEGTSGIRAGTCDRCETYRVKPSALLERPVADEVSGTLECEGESMRMSASLGDEPELSPLGPDTPSLLIW